VKVGREPSVGHDDDYAGMPLALFEQTAETASTAKAIRCAFAALPYQRGDGSDNRVALSNPGSVARIVSASSGTRRFTIGLASPASSPRSSKFFGVTFSDEYSPPIFIAIVRLSSGTPRLTYSVYIEGCDQR